MTPASSALTVVPLATRALMNDDGLRFALEHGRDALPPRSRTITTTLRLPDWLRRKATVAAILAMVGGLHVAAEISAIDLGDLAFAADHAALQFLGHRLAQLVQQHERALVGHVQIAGERQRRLALDLVAEDRDGREIAAQRQLVAGEQRPAGDA